MIEVKELQVNEEAVTPKGHRIVVMEQRDATTLIKVVETEKELDIPNWQLVTRLGDRETSTASVPPG